MSENLNLKLNVELSDEGKYSLTAIIAIALNELHCDIESDCSYAKETLNLIIDHFKLPKKFHISLYQFLNAKKLEASAFQFIFTLQEELYKIYENYESSLEQNTTKILKKEKTSENEIDIPNFQIEDLQESKPELSNLSTEEKKSIEPDNLITDSTKTQINSDQTSIENQPINISYYDNKILPKHKPTLVPSNLEKFFQSNALIFTEILQLTLENGVYDARRRVLLRNISFYLNFQWDKVESIEKSMVEYLQQQKHIITETEKKDYKEKSLQRKVKKYALIGAATIGGGTLLALTGGLAAPLLVAGVGTVLGGAGVAAFGSAAGLIVIQSLFGIAGAGLTAYKMNKRVGDLTEFEFEPLSLGQDLHVTIAVSGWMNSAEEDLRENWSCLANSKEQFHIKYESKYLLELGTAMNSLKKAALSYATQEALKQTVLNGVLSAIAWPATILSISGIIDNPWNVCMHRSELAGRQLAQVLLERQQGSRPVTLIGYSLGARVIFFCLDELCKRKNSYGIIEEVILLGAPVPASARVWSEFHKIVAGRIINGYCRSDWLLKFLYRAASVELSIAGLSPTKYKHRKLRNFDISSLVDGHLDYKNKIKEILKTIGIKMKSNSGVAQNLKVKSAEIIEKSCNIEEHNAEDGTSNTKNDTTISCVISSSLENNSNLSDDTSINNENRFTRSDNLPSHEEKDFSHSDNFLTSKENNVTISDKAPIDIENNINNNSDSIPTNQEKDLTRSNNILTNQEKDLPGSKKTF